MRPGRGWRRCWQSICRCNALALITTYQKGFSPMFPKLKRRLAMLFLLAAALPVAAHADDTLRLGVGLFQPDKEKNDATYRPLADYLAKKLGRKVQLRTVDSWEGLAKSLANGETDIALLGPWGYVLA